MPRPSWARYSSTPRPSGSIIDSARLQLLAAIAAQRVEDVARQALRVHADEHVVLAGDVALDHRDVVLVVDAASGSRRPEVAEAGRQRGRHDALDELVVAAPVGDQVGDRDHLQPVLWQYAARSSARAIVPSSFWISQMTPAGISPASRARSTDASVCPVRSRTPPARAFSGCTWPGLDDVAPALGGVDRDLHRVRLVVRR